MSSSTAEELEGNIIKFSQRKTKGSILMEDRVQGVKFTSDHILPDRHVRVALTKLLRLGESHRVKTNTASSTISGERAMKVLASRTCSAQMKTVGCSGAALEFGNGGFFYTHAPQTTPTLIDHTHQCMVIIRGFIII